MAPSLQRLVLGDCTFSTWFRAIAMPVVCRMHGG